MNDKLATVNTLSKRKYIIFKFTASGNIFLEYIHISITYNFTESIVYIYEPIMVHFVCWWLNNSYFQAYYLWTGLGGLAMSAKYIVSELGLD